MKKTPSLWGTPEMKELRVLTHDIAGNPNSCPLTKDNKRWSVRTDQLTKDIGHLLFNRAMPIGFNTDEIILCIVHADNVAFSNVVTKLGTTAMNTRRWKIVAIDGDKKHATVRVDSTLSSAGNLLIPGTIVLISNSIPTHWNCEDRNDARCTIVMQ